jgi:catechol 2,3-dioxygenase-like lactoylglutathione lyase family enzyme
MLHHVTLEVTTAGADRFAELLEAIGFAEVEPPPALRDGFRWFERDGTQVHLAVVAAPVVPPTGHTAFVAAPLEPALERLTGRGFEVEERRRHWGARRVSVEGPDGHRVELMEAPPGAD